MKFFAVLTLQFWVLSLSVLTLFHHFSLMVAATGFKPRITWKWIECFTTMLPLSAKCFSTLKKHHHHFWLYTWILSLIPPIGQKGKINNEVFSLWPHITNHFTVFKLQFWAKGQRVLKFFSPFCLLWCHKQDSNPQTYYYGSSFLPLNWFLHASVV